MLIRQVISDKFNIIENHISNEDGSNIIKKIENYIENFLSTDIHICPLDYINQAIWFNKIDKSKIIANINIQIKHYLIQHRNNIRDFIKKEKFSIQSLNKFLHKIIFKLRYLNIIICSKKTDIIKEGIIQLSNLLISDSLIILFIEDQFLNFDKKSYTCIKNFIDIVQSAHIYDNGEIFTKILKIMGNVFQKHIINVEDNPLPENLKRLQQIFDNIKFCNELSLHYKFIRNEFKIYGLYVVDIITQNLINIIKLSTLDEINFTLENIYLNLIKFYKRLENSDLYKFNTQVSNAVINFIDKFMSNIDQANLHKFINIINYIEEIFVKKNFIIEQKIEKMFNSEKVLEQIHIYINTLILNDNKENILKLLNYVINIKDKDLFVNNYYQSLVKRLMIEISKKEYYTKTTEKFRDYINKEHYYAQLIKHKFGSKLFYKLNKVISDTYTSYQDNYNFIITKQIPNINNLEKSKLQTITTSYNNWNINQTDGIITDYIIEKNNKSELCKYLKLYSSYYSIYRNNTKKVLNWFLHFGEVSMTYNKKDILLLPIQFMVVEMFEHTDSIPFKEIFEANFFVNYTHKFRSDIINSLVISKLFNFNGVNIQLSNLDNFNTNLIEIFFSNSDYINLWEEGLNNELIHSRKEITSSVINSLVKKSKDGIDLNELFNQTKTNIDVFELSQEIFDETIKYMCDQDYIIFDSNLNKYYKLYY